MSDFSLSRRAWHAMAIVAVLSCVGCPRPPKQMPAGAPKAIVLISIDTLRADAASFDASGPQTTPFLDSLASQGLVYTRAYAPASWTAPSMASLMTGLLPYSHGVRRGTIQRVGKVGSRSVVKQPPLAESFDTLAEQLQGLGFTTIGMPANLHLSARLGFAQGFDFYFKEAEFLEAPDVNKKAIELLTEAFHEDWPIRWKASPTFLWLHYLDPHIPYTARRPWIVRYAPEFASTPDAFPDGLDAMELARRYPRVTPDVVEHVKPLYLSEVSFVDDALRRLNEKLHFDDPNVLLIVTSDHGEEMGEHFQFGHGTTLFEEVVRIPLMVRWPAVLAPAHIDAPVSLIDVYPTVLALLKQPIPAMVQGRTLPLQATAANEDRPLFFQTDRPNPPLLGVLQGDWKLIRRKIVPGQPPRRPDLFNLRDDPAEKMDRGSSERTRVDRLTALIDEQLKKLPAPDGDVEVPVGDEATSERLRALGYH